MVWLGQSDAALGVTARTTMVLIAVGAVLMQLPLGALLASLAFGRDEDERPLRIVSALRAGMSAFLPLAVLLVLGTVASVVLLALGALASSAVDHGLTARLGDARAFRAHIVTFGLFAAIACVVGVFVDLARAAIGRDVGLAAANGTESSAWNILLSGVKTALTTSRQALPRATLAWAWRAVVGLILIALGYAAAEALGGRGGPGLLALFFVHQAVVLARVALRASWMARALALVAPVQDTREPVPARTPLAAEPT